MTENAGNTENVRDIGNSEVACCIENAVNKEDVVCFLKAENII